MTRIPRRDGLEACHRVVEQLSDTLTEIVWDLSVPVGIRYRIAQLRDIAEQHLVDAGVLS